MDVLYERCAGLDVHKKSVVACVLRTELEGSVRPQVRPVGTMTDDLQALRPWVQGQQVVCVALESTGLYGVPVFTLLEEGGHQVIVVNPQHSKAVPGRKTAITDSPWLADLLRPGLLQPSFIPPAAIRALRARTRYRKSLVRERTQEVNRLHKVLASAKITRAAVATDVLGVSGRLLLEALARGEEDPEVLADLAHGPLRDKLEALQRALEGRVKPQHRVLIRTLLQHIAPLEGAIGALDEESARALRPFQRPGALLRRILV